MLIDSHVHFDDPRFDNDRDAVYQRAKQAGVIAMIMPATIAESWPKTKQCSDQYENVFPAYGLHPYFIDQHKREHLDQLKGWIKKEQPVAVGECGLDYFLPELDQEKQKNFFEAQLEIAKESDLPIIIHARSAVEDVINLIRKSGHQKGMIHSYNGSLQQAKQLIDLGYYLSFGGTATYTRAKKLRTLIKELPLESLLIETDAPDQPCVGHKDQRNEPEFIVEVLKTFAELRSETKERIAQQTMQNAISLFNLPNRFSFPRAPKEVPLGYSCVGMHT